MGKAIGYYPKGHINQHKSLATGAGLEKCDKRDLGGGFDSKPTKVPGRTNIKSGTSTGSGYKGSVPKSTFTKA